MVPHASLCVTAYKRTADLQKCLKSLKETADYSHTIIVNVDGGDDFNRRMIDEMVGQKYISYGILVGGNNRGIGKSFQNCLSLAEGDYIFKLDSDLLFKPNWLSKTIKILKNNPDVGAVGMFDYHLQDPSDERFKPENNILEEREDCYIVKDFVSCAYAFKRSDLLNQQFYQKSLDIPDDGVHQWFSKLALVKQSVVDNFNFGTRSVYVSFDESDKPFKTPTHEEPLIFLSGLSSD